MFRSWLTNSAGLPKNSEALSVISSAFSLLSYRSRISAFRRTSTWRRRAVTQETAHSIAVIHRGSPDTETVSAQGKTLLHPPRPTCRVRMGSRSSCRLGWSIGTLQSGQSAKEKAMACTR